MTSSSADLFACAAAGGCVRAQAGIAGPCIAAAVRDPHLCRKADRTSPDYKSAYETYVKGIAPAFRAVPAPTWTVTWAGPGDDPAVPEATQLLVLGCDYRGTAVPGCCNQPPTWHCALGRGSEPGRARWADCVQCVRTPEPTAAPQPDDRPFRSFVRAVGQHAREGWQSVAPAVKQARLSLCLTCEHVKIWPVLGPQCLLCRCMMNVKAGWPEMFCPAGKWGKAPAAREEGPPARPLE